MLDFKNDMIFASLQRNADQQAVRLIRANYAEQKNYIPYVVKIIPESQNTADWNEFFTQIGFWLLSGLLSLKGQPGCEEFFLYQDIRQGQKILVMHETKQKEETRSGDQLDLPVPVSEFTALEGNELLRQIGYQTTHFLAPSVFQYS